MIYLVSMLCAGAMTVVLLITEVPVLQTTCGTDSIPAVNWGYAIG
jgi:hypothetical protein